MFSYLSLILVPDTEFLNLLEFPGWVMGVSFVNDAAGELHGHKPRGKQPLGSIRQEGMSAGGAPRLGNTFTFFSGAWRSGSPRALIKMTRQELASKMENGKGKWILNPRSWCLGGSVG